MRSKLVAARKTNGWTVAHVAEKLGISESFLYKIEAGVRNPTIELANQMACLFGATVDELFFGRELGDSSNGATSDRPA
jgi:putative transcriptional regulator